MLYEEDGGERAVEVETGSNNDAQVLENLEKSVDFQGEGQFVVVDEGTYNRVVQIASRHAYKTRERLCLKVAVVEDLPEWDMYRVAPVPPASQ